MIEDPTLSRVYILPFKKKLKIESALPRLGAIFGYSIAYFFLKGPNTGLSSTCQAFWFFFTIDDLLPCG